MATSTSNLVCDNSTLANFKAWATTFGAALSAFGWVQTSDTGQVNWSSIAAVPSSTYVYEIWKMGDALQSTMPVFLKLYYGFSTTSPRMEMLAGTGTDGAGNLTGNVTSSGSVWPLTQQNSNQGATTFPCYFSGSSSSFRCLMWENPVTGSSASASTVHFGIERSRDGTGAETGDYFTAWHLQNFISSASTPNYAQQQTISASALGPVSGAIISAAPSGGTNTGIVGSDVSAFPVSPIIGKVGNPLLGLLVAYPNDVADQAIVTITNMYGASHTYIAFYGANLSNLIGARAYLNTTGIAGLMLYE